MSVLGPVKPYFTYAAQMREPMPIIAYFCKFYAVQHGLKLADQAADKEKGKAAKEYLMNDLGDLEAMKKAMGDTDKEAQAVYVENFVMSVFAKTDQEERTCETITKKNAVDFNRAGHFINLLSLCNNGEVAEEW